MMTWSLWMTAAIVLLVIEILTPGTFFFACLSVGAASAGLVSLLNPPFWLPWIIFTSVSLISIYSIRPIAKKLLKYNVKKSNVDALVGQKAFVAEAIIPPQLGMVKVEGELWRAESSEKIEAGSSAEVVAVKGTKLEVKKIS